MEELNNKQTTNLNEEKINNKLALALVVLYLIAVIWIVIFKCNFNEALFIEGNRSMPLLDRFIYHLNHSMIVAIIHDAKKGDFIELFAAIFNVIGFIFVGMSFRHFLKRWVSILISILFVFTIELFQLFSCIGGLQISDLVLNILGCIIGIIIYEKHFHKIKPKIVNKTLLILVIIAIPCDIFFIINTIIHWPWL